MTDLVIDNCSVLTTPLGWPTTAKFLPGDRVRKHSGSWWEGRIVGFYSTEQTPIGYDVQLDFVPNGPTQLFPEAAFELAGKAPSLVYPEPSLPAPDRVTELEATVAELLEGLKPFGDQDVAASWADENGWTETAPNRERICDWFGPSDFRTAAALLAKHGGSTSA